MTKLDWKKSGEDALMKTRGSERIGEDRQAGDGPAGFTRDSPFWLTASGGKVGDLYRAATIQKTAAGEINVSALVALLRALHSMPGAMTNIKGLGDSELRECREICQSIVRELNDQLIKRATLGKKHGK